MSEDGQDGAEEAIEAIEVRRNPWLLGLAASPLVLAAMLLLGTEPYSGCAGPLAALAGLAAVLLTWRHNPMPRRVPVRLRADRAALAIEDVASGTARSVPVRSMVRGVRTPGPVAMVLVQITRRLAPSVSFETSATLEPPLLTRLGLDARQTTASFRGMSRMHAARWRMGTAASVAGLITVAIGLGGVELTPWALTLIPPVLLVPLALVLIPSRIDVGADGVLIRWAGTRRYVRHADIVATTTHPLDDQRRDVLLVILGTHAGESVAIPMAIRSSWYDDADALSSRIHDARAAWQAGQGRAPVPLLRGDRDHALWVAALRKQEAADLRSTAVPRAELWRVVEDLGGAPIDRAAAALALGRVLGDADRERLERAAKTTVAPKLRVVLERAAIADDDELAQRLQTLERE